MTCGSINMKKLNIAIGADHHGFDFKESLKRMTTLEQFDISWVDVGAQSEDRSDYPIFAIKAVEAMLSGKAEYAVLLCGTGNGMAIAANRIPGIYAGVVWNARVAELAKTDDNVNVLVLPADYINLDLAQTMFTVWLLAEFKEGRYAERISIIDSIDV